MSYVSRVKVLPEVEKEESEKVLKKWHKLAAKSKSMEEFIENMDKV